MLRSSQATMILLLNSDIAQQFQGLSKDNAALAQQFGGEPWAQDVLGDEGVVKSQATIGQIGDINTVDGIQLGQGFRLTAASYMRATAGMVRLNRQIPLNSAAFRAIESAAKKVDAIVAQKPHYATAFAPAREAATQIVKKAKGNEFVTLADVRTYWTSLAIAYTNAAVACEQTVEHDDENDDDVTSK